MEVFFFLNSGKDTYVVFYPLSSSWFCPILLWPLLRISGFPRGPEAFWCSCYAYDPGCRILEGVQPPVPSLNSQSSVFWTVFSNTCSAACCSWALWNDDLLDPGSDLEKSFPSWYTSASSCSDWEEPRREPHAWSGCNKLAHSPKEKLLHLSSLVAHLLSSFPVNRTKLYRPNSRYNYLVSYSCPN